MQVVRIVLLGLAGLVLVAAIWLTGCGKGEVPPASIAAGSGSSTTPAASPAVTPAATTKKPTPKAVDPIVIIHTSAGDIQVQLSLEKAPQTVENFLANYASRQFYEGTIFHHIEAGSMVIAGGYTADLSPKPTRYPVLNEANNGLANKRGTIAMIRDPSSPHSATSQFYFNVADNPGLDFQSDETNEGWGYCVFGQVVAGMDVVDRIAQAQVAPQGDFEKVPQTAVVIKSVEQLR
jgi:cyclophilin family peptidyl-prolyl cis-trans isomerase